MAALGAHMWGGENEGPEEQSCGEEGGKATDTDKAQFWQQMSRECIHTALQAGHSASRLHLCSAFI